MTRPSLLAAAALAALFFPHALAVSVPDGWTKLEGCRLDPSSYADGDSFRAVHEGKTHHFRLYFVDCPETDERYPDRLAEQQSIFGLGPEGIIAAGHKATQFTTDFLSRPFTVLTKWEDARGASHDQRFYAVVLDGAGRDLAVELTRNGWARAYGMHSEYRGRSHEIRLKNLEAAARRQGLGAFEGSTAMLADSTNGAKEQEYQDPEEQVSDSIMDNTMDALNIGMP
jgi:endonuclease YncB( thermonuclease family)